MVGQCLADIFSEPHPFPCLMFFLSIFFPQATESQTLTMYIINIYIYLKVYICLIAIDILKHNIRCFSLTFEFLECLTLVLILLTSMF